jgi:hypothetical protein
MYLERIRSKQWALAWPGLHIQNSGSEHFLAQ